MKKLNVSLIVITLLLGQFSLAGCPEDCRAALSAADKVISDQQQEIEIYKGLSIEQTKQITSLSSSINEKNQELSNLMRNPWFIGTLGILVGGAGVLLLQK